jgi:hypothetical protein
MTSDRSVIEADLDSDDVSTGGTAAVLCDPVASALRRQGFRSVSVGLRTAQVDGVLYQLCPTGAAAMDDWLSGYRLHQRTRIRLVRKSMCKEKLRTLQPDR